MVFRGPAAAPRARSKFRIDVEDERIEVRRDVVLADDERVRVSTSISQVQALVLENLLHVLADRGKVLAMRKKIFGKVA